MCSLGVCVQAVTAVRASQRETYDVYVNSGEQLDEGVKKHILSVFVADESGMINRVAGVFARRGANIESLAVGLCEDKALFTIVATGTDSVISNLSKQVAKLVNVRYVEDITDIEHIGVSFASVTCVMYILTNFLFYDVLQRESLYSSKFVLRQGKDV